MIWLLVVLGSQICRTTFQWDIRLPLCRKRQRLSGDVLRKDVGKLVLPGVSLSRLPCLSSLATSPNTAASHKEDEGETARKDVGPPTENHFLIPLLLLFCGDGRVLHLASREESPS